MKRKMKTIPKIIIIFFVSLISFLPFYYTIVMATHSTDQVMRGLEFVPGGYLLDNLKTVTQNISWLSATVYWFLWYQQSWPCL